MNRYRPARPTRRRFLAATATAYMASLGLPASVMARATRSGGTLVVGSTQVPRHLNGAVQSGLATAVPSTQLFASPLRFDDDWQPQPYLAESWELAQDGLSLTLKLRPDAVFHDGQPITSGDVAFSIMAIKKYHPFQSMFAAVSGVDTPDPNTAVIRLDTPHPAILLVLSPALCPILPKHVYDDGTDLRNHPRNSAGLVGSGPFRLVEFVPSQQIEMAKFDKFFLPGKPYLDKLIIRINPDSQSLVLGFEQGEIHMLPFYALSTDLARFQANPKANVTSRGYEAIGAFTWLNINLKRAPLDNAKVRQAIAHCIDRKFITKALNRGFSEPREGPLLPGSPYASDDLHRYRLDLERAGQLLDEAGHPRGKDGARFKLTIDYIPGNNEQQKTLAEYLKAQLRKVGIMLDIRALPDFPTWAKYMAAHDYDMTMDLPFDWPDPIIGVHRFYVSSNIKNAVWTNTGSYSNPEVDRLLDAAATEIDPARRRELYAAFQKIVTDDLPYIPMTSVPYHTVTSKKVGNVPATIWGPMSPLDEVYLD